MAVILYFMLVVTRVEIDKSTVTSLFQEQFRYPENTLYSNTYKIEWSGGKFTDDSQYQV